MVRANFSFRRFLARFSSTLGVSVVACWRFKKGYPDYLVGMRERKVADKLNPQRIGWLMAR